jgi:translation initiation factor 3 subunit L
MADPTAFYQPEEDELLNSLAVPTYQSDLNTNYDDEYRRLQELEEHAYAQQVAVAEEMEQRAQLEQVPEDVKRVSWAACAREKNADLRIL